MVKLLPQLKILPKVLYVGRVSRQKIVVEQIMATTDIMDTVLAKALLASGLEVSRNLLIRCKDLKFRTLAFRVLEEVPQTSDTGFMTNFMDQIA